MEARLVRRASEQWKKSMEEVNQIFTMHDVYHYVKEFWGLFHVEGDRAVLEDVETYINNREKAL